VRVFLAAALAPSVPAAASAQVDPQRGILEPGTAGALKTGQFEPAVAAFREAAASAPQETFVAFSARRSR
jgi:hypothetical protein